ncbi:hypothetical protein HZU77_004855 [Neisseriaceae bacterium TC5R-5]|nr:hypothetical protein [Neisseriaceae bacterium TC5R-5]
MSELTDICQLQRYLKQSTLYFHELRLTEEIEEICQRWPLLAQIRQSDTPLPSLITQQTEAE